MEITLKIPGYEEAQITIPPIHSETPAETQKDLDNENYFKSGWEAALNEVKLAIANNKLEEFFNEVVPSAPSGPGQEEPIDNLIDWEAPSPDIKRVSGPGESIPDSEPEVNAGTWTISDAELNSIREAERAAGYARGLAHKIEHVIDGGN